MTPQPTADEIQRVRRHDAEQECALHGHDFEVLEAMNRGPVSVVCGRCGKSWVVDLNETAANRSSLPAEDGV